MTSLELLDPSLSMFCTCTGLVWMCTGLVSTPEVLASSSQVFWMRKGDSCCSKSLEKKSSINILQKISAHERDGLT